MPPACAGARLVTSDVRSEDVDTLFCLYSCNVYENKSEEHQESMRESHFHGWSMRCQPMLGFRFSASRAPPCAEPPNHEPGSPNTARSNTFTCSYYYMFVVGVSLLELGSFLRRRVSAPVAHRIARQRHPIIINLESESSLHHPISTLSQATSL